VIELRALEIGVIERLFVADQFALRSAEIIRFVPEKLSVMGDVPGAAGALGDSLMSEPFARIVVDELCVDDFRPKPMTRRSRT
jgi:hypothetical protein